MEHGMVQVRDMRKKIHCNSVNIRLQVRHRYTVWCAGYLQCMELKLIHVSSKAFYSLGYFQNKWSLKATLLYRASKMLNWKTPVDDLHDPQMCWSVVYQLVGRLIMTSQCKERLLEDIWSRRGLRLAAYATNRLLPFVLAGKTHVSGVRYHFAFSFFLLLGNISSFFSSRASCLIHITLREILLLINSFYWIAVCKAKLSSVFPK